MAPALLITLLAAALPAAAAQTDAELRSVVQQAMATHECFSDQYDSAVWYTLMEPKLRRYVADRGERLAMLQTVYCESHRAGAAPLPPGWQRGPGETARLRAIGDFIAGMTDRFAIARHEELVGPVRLPDRF